ncbi:Peptidase, family M23/M37 [Bosea sp. LC85]|uniref:M23 family metallopeptidase n=1 Tax=Bosea sp. LC85 TaxID=1502851 RepID=UPI0004E3D68A|nr:M23 family metallopeptidase [Bosea sp. LC85]KFC69227.1 Peptidase, family M23/M37 [Bosea sp. LC85]
MTRASNVCKSSAPLLLALATAALAENLPREGLPREDLPRFVLPLSCEVGRNCFIQNYVDADPTSSAKDYACGSLSYDKHNGTDFRLATMTAQRAGVDVLAAADGRVVRLRDGSADASVRDTGRAAVQGSECGNGVVIEHADGWQTQYCHMAQGSLQVNVGDLVRAPQPIGKVGLSGLTEYPHLHFIVRRHGQIVDPFAYEAPAQACGAGQSLWDPALGPALAYRQRSILNAGFASTPVSMAALEAGETEQNLPDFGAPALVAYARGIGLKTGDVQSLVLKDPSGRTLAENQAPPLERNRAQSLIFAGVKQPAAGWAKGAYQATYTVTQNGTPVLERRFDIDLGPQ